MLLGVRLFVALLYTLIGLSFAATTGVLIYEFRDSDWLTVAAFYSHLFVFFPTFGIAALLAFYTPSCVFMDLYWRYVPLGRLRFTAGLLVLAALSAGGAMLMLASPERSVWEIEPATLMSDRGEPQGCVGSPTGCQRM